MVAETWSLALAALAALAVAVDCACHRGFEPLNKTMRRLAMNGPITWEEVDNACSEQFPGGFQMLGRDFLLLSDEDKALCQGHSVPLRLEKIGQESVAWSGKPLQKEDVNSTYLDHMHADPTQKDATNLVGSLTPSTGQWRLVDNDTVFDCAICQRAWIVGFWLLKYDTPEDKPYAASYTFRLVAKGGDSVDVDEAIHLVEERLNGTADRDGDLRQVKIDKVASDPDGGNGTLVGLKSSRSLQLDDVVAALNGSLGVESWQAKHLCPSSSFDNIEWQETSGGEVDFSQQPDFKFVTRRCSWRKNPEGDREPVWDDEVFVWTNRMDKCQSNIVSKFLCRLEKFLEQADPEHLDLKPLVEATNDVNVRDLPEEKLFHVTDAITDVLSSLIASTANASSACQGSACAFLADHSHGQEGLGTWLVPHKGPTPTFLSAKDSDAVNHTTYISLHLPRETTSAGRVAVHTWRSFQIFVSDKKIDDSLIAQVVSSTPFDESTPERNRPAVTFRVNNTGVGPVFRYRSVWNLAENQNYARPCPLVRSEELVDTYLCNKWIRKLNVTTLSLVAFKLVADQNFTNYFVDHVLQHVLLGYTTIPIDKSAILEVAKFSNAFVAAVLEKDSIELNAPKVDILNPWEEILSGVFLTVEEPVLTVSLDHVKILVSDLAVNDPVVGFSLDKLAGVGSVQTVTAGSRDVSAESEVNLVLGAGVQEHCQQLAVLAVTDVAGFYMNGSLEASIKKKLMVVYLVVTPRNETEANSGDVYFEIHLGGNDRENVIEETQNESQGSGVTPRFKVATWSETARDWLVSSCTNQQSTRASKWVVRCEHLAFTDQQFRGSYLIFEPIG